jgi:hypothetical protein
MELSKRQLRVRRVLKRVLYFQLYMRDAWLILFGKARPFIPFKVEASPPSIYIHFEIRPEMREALARRLDLPYGLELAPLRCLRGEEPFDCLVLNVYRVSGITNGLRAEWSVYVRDASGKSRYLIVEARSDVRSLDPVDLLTKASSFAYVQEGDELRIDFECGEGAAFRARCRAPRDAPRVEPAGEWIEANDEIYWINGISDRALYDGGLACGDVRVVDRESLELEDGSAWASFVAPAPRHTLVLGNAMTLMISPWWNLDELDGAGRERPARVRRGAARYAVPPGRRSTPIEGGVARSWQICSTSRRGSSMAASSTSPRIG